MPRPDGTLRTRAIRKDRHTLWTVFASYPVPRETVEADSASRERALFERWKELNIAFLKEKYGDQLKSVFEHVDETFGHIHAYVLPECFDDLNARDFNPAYQGKMAAEQEAEAAGTPPRLKVKLGNQAYRERASEMADEYFEHVGQPAGLTREGPKRRRLSRSAWRREKAHACAASELALRTAEENMLRELEPIREALEAVRRHQVALARREAAEATERHLQEAAKHVSAHVASTRERFASAYAVLQGSDSAIGELAREIWQEVLPGLEPPSDVRGIKQALLDLQTKEFFALQDAVEDNERLEDFVKTTKQALSYVGNCLAKGLKWSLQSLHEIGRAAADAVHECIERLAKQLAEEEAIPMESLATPEAAAEFLRLREDAKQAVEKAFTDGAPARTRAASEVPS